MVSYPDVASVRVLEVKDGGPIVRRIFLESTGGASGLLSVVNRRVHGNVEGIL